MSRPGLRETAAAVREALQSVNPGNGGLSPLVSSYWGQAGGGNAALSPASLPRPNNVFTSGQFSPLAPIIPAPIDMPEPDGDILPRRTQQEIGWNLPIGQPGSEGPQAGKLANFSTLRTLALKDPISQECIQRRVAEMAGLIWDVMPTRAAEQAMKGSIVATRDWQKRKAEVMTFLERIDRSPESPYDSTEDVITAAFNDELTIDAKGWYLHAPQAGDGKGGLNSNLASLDYIDGSTLRPLYSIHYGRPPAPAVAYQQFIWGIPRMDFYSMMEGRDVAEVPEGNLIQTFHKSELIYQRYYASSWAPYGMSPVERGLTMIALGIARLSGQLEYYSSGTVPYCYVVVGPEMFQNPQQIKMFQVAMNTMVGDIGWKQKVRVLPPGSDIKDMKPHPLADQFDELLVAYRTMLFGYTPGDLGIFPNVSQTQTPSAVKLLGSTQTTDTSSRWMNPRAKRWETFFNRIIRFVLHQPDMLFSFTGLEEPQDLTTKVQLIAAQLSTPLNLISLDEGRVDLGLEPYGLPETSLPWVNTTNGPVPITLAMQLAHAQLDALQMQGVPVGGVGTTGGTPDRSGGPGGPRKDSSGEMTTPSHEGRSRGSFDRDTEGVSRKVDTREQKAELAQLGRYLGRGKDLDGFESKYLSPAVMGVIEATTPAGLKAALAAGEAQIDLDAEHAIRDVSIGAYKAAVVPALSSAFKRLGALGLTDEAVEDVARSKWQIVAALDGARSKAFADAAGEEREIPTMPSEITRTIVKAAAARDYEFAAKTALDEIEFAYEIGEMANKGVVSNPHPYTERFLIRYFMEGAGGRVRWGFPGDFMACVHIAEKHLPGGAEQAKAFCQHLHYMTTGKPAGHAPAELAAKEAGQHKAMVPDEILPPDYVHADVLALVSGPRAGQVSESDTLDTVTLDTGGDSPLDGRAAAGIAVRARDTGRVLMMRRADDGKLEFPGGKLELGEVPLDGAKREWREEVGTDLPPGRPAFSWTSPDGSYEGFVWETAFEASVEPRSPDADEVGSLAWLDPQEARQSPELSDRVRQSPWHRISSGDHLGKASAPPQGQQKRKQNRKPPPPPLILIPHFEGGSAAPTWQYDLEIARHWAPLIAAGLATVGLAGLAAALAGLYADALYVGKEEAMGHEPTDFQPGNQVVTAEAQAAATEALTRVREDTPHVDVASQERSILIAETEAMRGMVMAAQEVYSEAQVAEYLWLALPDACPACKANEAASPYPLGGGPLPPEHPRCRCWTVPAAS